MSAQARRVLVVTVGEIGGLPEAIQDRVARAPAEVLVVTPARSSLLRHWLSDIDEAYEAAGERACRCAEELRLSGFDAEAIVGDRDPAQAIEDGLALFDADFVVVDRDLAERARRRFGLPIVSLADAA
jgi:predicted nicotinamide N-methyase